MQRLGPGDDAAALLRELERLRHQLLGLVEAVLVPVHVAQVVERLGLEVLPAPLPGELERLLGDELLGLEVADPPRDQPADAQRRDAAVVGKRLERRLDQLRRLRQVAPRAAAPPRPAR